MKTIILLFTLVLSGVVCATFTFLSCLMANNGWIAYAGITLGLILFFFVWMYIGYFLLRMVARNCGEISILSPICVLALGGMSIYFIWHFMNDEPSAIDYASSITTTIISIIYSYSILQALRPSQESIRKVMIDDMMN